MDSLQTKAEEFALELNQLISKVFPGRKTQFKARALKGGVQRVVITTFDVLDGLEQEVPLEVFLSKRNSKIKLLLSVRYECFWSIERGFLAVQKSSMEFRMAGYSNPLFRYDFDKNASENTPVAHFQIHAHRDELTWLMLQGRTYRAKARIKKDKPPLLSAIHFPVGGERFRPSVEDFIEFCIIEFGLKVKINYKEALRNGRVKWKQLQLSSAIFDDPEHAANTLVRLGWEVTKNTELSLMGRLRNLQKL